MSERYTRAELQRLLTEDGAVTEQGIDVFSAGPDRIVLRGRVETPQRRAAIEERIRGRTGVARIDNEITIAGHGAPGGHEELA